MCGIIGYTGIKESRDILLNGLKKLEYRGYDSAGLAIYNGGLNIIKTQGSIKALREKTPLEFTGKTGIAHTRWATHGEPSELNSHPHMSVSGNLVMVHNGIIENSEELKEIIGIDHSNFKSETDSEVLLNLIDKLYLENGRDLLEALIGSLSQCTGSYAAVIIELDRPDELMVCRKGSPIVIGIDSTGSYVASDIYALAEHTEKFYFPEEGDIVNLGRSGILKAYTCDGHEKQLAEKIYYVEDTDIGKNGYDHYMHKEIYEQPAIIGKLFKGGLKIESLSHADKKTDELLRNAKRITILGCGTSWHAGLVGKYLIEKFARIPVNTEYASEYRYRHPVISEDDLVISISQSGETADTLAANKLAKESGALTMGIINVAGSTLERETDLQVYLSAGPEVGVASTKAYTSQLAILSMLTEKFCELHKMEENAILLENSFSVLPDYMDWVLSNSPEIEKIANKYAASNNFLFLGRGLNFPSALEGALKLKEISYIHAEGYPGAEMKHGPIALIDYNFPTLAIVTDRENRAKMISNIREIKARKGKIIAICAADDKLTPTMVDDVIILPDVKDELTPVLTAIPLQLFAYYVSLSRGCNVDQPRNLAKSVTVE
jgi:glucosamine--fructose-6-phosphate aminotransferase (isomerizing)